MPLKPSCRFSPKYLGVRTHGVDVMENPDVATYKQYGYIWPTVVEAANSTIKDIGTFPTLCILMTC